MNLQFLRYYHIRSKVATLINFIPILKMGMFEINLLKELFPFFNSNPVKKYQPVTL